MSKPSAKPEKSRPYVECVASGGTWKWRARVRVGTRMCVGSLRDDEERAYADAIELLDTRDRAASGQPTTLVDALALLVERQEESGITAASVDGTYRNQARAILTWMDPHTPLSSITPERVLAMARLALRDGRAPITVSKHYLRVLAAALRCAGRTDEPVQQARRLGRNLLRTPDPVREWFRPEELRDVLERVRSYRGQRPIPTQQRAADTMELVALTGIRSLELSRVRVRDVDLERAEIHVREPKDPRRPRVLPLPDRAVACARRLVDGRAPDVALIRGGVSALDHMYTAWSRRLGVPKLNGRCLRRSFASGLDLLGASLATIRDGMGHAPDSPVTPRYLRTDHEILRAAVARLSDAIEPPSTSGPASAAPWEDPRTEAP